MVWTFEHLENKSAASGTLTSHEREVAQYIVNGYTSKETVHAMGISPRTVKMHRSSVMKKLGVQNAAELVAKMIVQS